METSDSRPKTGGGTFWGYISWGLIGFNVGCLARLMIWAWPLHVDRLLENMRLILFDPKYSFVWDDNVFTGLNVRNFIVFIPAFVILGVYVGRRRNKGILGKWWFTMILTVVTVVMTCICELAFMAEQLAGAKIYWERPGMEW